MYNFAGYIIHSVKNNAKVCDECLKGVICNDDDRKGLPSHSKLLELREYKKGALIAVNQRCFEMFQTLEKKI